MYEKQKQFLLDRGWSVITSKRGSEFFTKEEYVQETQQDGATLTEAFLFEARSTITLAGMVRDALIQSR